MARRVFRSIGDNAIAVADPSASDASCFADEVAIDFPSVARAIDRMRTAFVADERESALPAAIQLSRREARTGTRVPLHVPIRSTCRACGGRGETWTEPCGRCDGDGSEVLSQQVHVAVPAGVSNGALFRFSVAHRHDIPTRIELRIFVE